MANNKIILVSALLLAQVPAVAGTDGDAANPTAGQTIPESPETAVVQPRKQETAILDGVVIDHTSGEPVIGANVYDPTSKNGAVTDVDGKFTLQVSVPTTIRVSFIGYEPRTLYINNESARKKQRIDLLEEHSALDEVVVVGYGTQRRTQLTGSVTTVGKQVLETNLTPTLDQALGGTVAGLNITASSGQPGAASSVRIRGGNSVNASNEPLYVIDGFIYFKSDADNKTGIDAIESSLSPLLTVNPSDIERIEVLKDVSATAIYGSRGANGVIIVTTKKGSRDRTSIHYRYSAGIDVVSKKLDLMNAQEFATYNKQYFNNIGGYTDSEIATLGKGTDWQDALLQTGSHQSHEFSVTGGNDKTRYAFSANYTTQDGIILNSGFDRYNFHLNFERELAKGLTFSSNTTFGKSIQNGLTTTSQSNSSTSPFGNGITNSFVYGLMMPPTVSVYTEDGDYNYTNPYEHAYFALGTTAANPVSDLKNSVAESINAYVLANYSLRYVWKELTFKASAGVNRERITQNYFSPSYTALGLASSGLVGIGNKSNESWLQEYTVDWNHSFPVAELSALAGYTRQDTRSNWFTQMGRLLTNDAKKQYSLADAETLDTPVADESSSNLNSVIGRVNYTLRGRYNATATIRGDRSSRLTADGGWGWFPSLGLSWNVSEEDFLKNHRFISNLKVRLSAGTVGNQEIGDLDYALQYTAGKYAGSASYSISNSGADLKWETTASFNAGFDLGFFDNRLEFEADAYYKKNSDLLLEVPQGIGSSTATQMENVGNVENRGVELSVTGDLIRTGNLQWSASANIAFNRNEVTKTSGSDVISGVQSQMILREGESLGSFYGLKFKGYENGQATFEDYDGNGAISYNDRIVLGSIQPEFTYGFSSTLTWKNLDAYVGFQGSYGNELYNSTGRLLSSPTASYNLLRSTKVTQTRPTNYIDSRYVEDASYLKLKNLTVGYTFKLQAGRTPFSIRVFAQASNLLTVTGYSGYDPEVSGGTDTSAYPSSRSFTFGAGITF